MGLFNETGKTPAKDFATRLGSKNRSEAEANGRDLIMMANKLGTDIEGVILHHVSSDKSGLDPVEAVFSHINIPLTAKDPRAKAMFAAGTETFVTSGSLKLLIPVLMDNLVREAKNRPLTENVYDLIASDRRVGGNELITEIIYDKATGDAYDSWRVPEGSKIPVRTLKATQNAVRFYKLGSGLEFTYEAGRRISIDRFIPFINRQKFERTQAEARYAVNVLLQGDGVHAAAPVKNITAYGATSGTLRDNPEAFLKWLMEAAKANRPIDTIVVNYDSLYELGFMFPVYKESANNAGVVESVGVQKIAGSTVGLSVNLKSGLSLNIQVLVSSEIPADSILGYRKDETLERLEEIGSVIQEQEATIRTQTILIVGTVNVGFAIAYGESRQVLTWA